MIRLRIDLVEIWKSPKARRTFEKNDRGDRTKGRQRCEGGLGEEGDGRGGDEKEESLKVPCIKKRAPRAQTGQKNVLYVAQFANATPGTS